MATDVLSLFNMPTQEQIGRSYLEGMLTSPQQMGAQSLLQQVVSLGGNAGAGIGYGVGRLMGGMTADEVRAKSIDDAMRTVQGMGLTSDAEMYGALSQELARRGLTQDALKARDVGLKAAQTEQSMKTEQARLDIARKDLELKQAQDKREAELAPVKIEALKEDINKTRESLKPVQQKLAESATEIERLSAEKPNSPELRAALGRYQGFADAIAQANREIAIKERELDIRSRQAEASMVSAQAAASRAEALANQESFTKTEVAEFIPGMKTVIGKYSSKQNKYMANDGNLFNTRQELEDYVKSQTTQAQPATTAPKGSSVNWQQFMPPQQPKQ